MHSIIFHAHQKLDRVARKHLAELLPDTAFPSSKQILHFEAGHGPDGARLKRQRAGQPWHFIDPEDLTDTQLHQEIRHHYENLVDALKKADNVRAAFEAAWLAHAIVDGLTPAHHYPYEQELSEIRGGEDKSTRKGLAGRLYVKGDTVAASVKQSLKLVGPNGLLTSHAMFEAGAYTLIAPLKLKAGLPTPNQIKDVTKRGVVAVFTDIANEIAEMDIYEHFCKIGWTQTISQDVRREMAPRMVRMITLSWYSACRDAGARP